MNPQMKNDLIQAAISASEFSYSPYSHFPVGAALLSSDNQIITGANIENISFGLSICAERSAISNAFIQGITSFQAIAIYSPMAIEPLQPCGACRQVLSEFAKADFPLFLINKDGHSIETSLGAIFPASFHSLGEASSKNK